ncbi:GFA family protein [Sandaracinus amylolyticus]|uniref:GFA family protein n=1 Tax=Sandaracinus amylolyticus TaxID=927083 RepID=UPI001F4913FC|nr:GFA family protein [Sandaracinus amylolyticus]UJR80709.1 Glutathione-dependent formaldehyde-activating enzyme [Sandaracinus amylolyticus]
MSAVHGRGRCLCGAISFEVHAPMREVSFCHCGMCRRVHGYAGAYTTALVDSFVLHDAQGALRWYRSSEHVQRGFCGTCGTTLFWQHEGSKVRGVTAGSLDAPTGLRAGVHIHVADKGDWYELPDDGLERRQGSFS